MGKAGAIPIIYIGLNTSFNGRQLHHLSSGLKLSVRFYLVFAPSNGADAPSALRTRTPQKSPFLVPEVVFFCVFSVALGTLHKQSLVFMRVPASWFDVVDG